MSKSDKDSLGDRMKRYEGVPRTYLTPRMPLICRLDGRAFHSYTRGFEKPFDAKIMDAMTGTAKELVKQISGAKLAYIQSDEISILVTDFEKFETKPWFDKDLQKIVSVSASIATAVFNSFKLSNKLATFDSRAFVLPTEEVANYFFWRQLDAERNSISSLAQSQFSHKSLNKKNCAEMKAMLKEKGIDWDGIDNYKKRGWCVYFPEFVDKNIPRFKDEGREYIEKHLVRKE